MHIDRTSVVFLILLVVLVLLAGAVAWRVSAPRMLPAPEAAHSLGILSGGSYTDLSGAPISLTEYGGAPLLVLSWASWAPGSDEALRELIRIADTGSISALAINRGEQLPVVESYLSYAGIPRHDALVLDGDDFFFRTNESFDMPAVYLFDGTGGRVMVGRGVDALTTLSEAASGNVPVSR